MRLIAYARRYFFNRGGKATVAERKKMKLAASILALARADLWSAKWNPFSSPSACTDGLTHL